MDLPVPEKVKKVFSQPGLNVFCSLGSSGYPETLKLIVEALKSSPNINLVCSTTTILKPAELGENNERFFATEFLPAHLVNEMADVAILHGGQGTIQTAVWAGTPVVGIGFQAEQQANIDGIAKQGMAIRIPIFKVTPKRILKAVEKISGETYRSNAKRMQAEIRKVDGVQRSVDTMNKFLLGLL